MKSGASDPFADDTPTEEESDDTSQSTDSTMSESPTDAVETDSTPSSTGGFDRSDLPYKLRRDKVKDERESVHQLFVQDETDTEERNARRNLEDRFDEDVFKLDAREAIYLAGIQNLGDAEDVLREWGYDL